MKKLALLFVVTSILMACGGDTNEIENNKSSENPQDGINTSDRAGKAANVFYTVPSPLEMASIFENAGSSYNSTISNPVENVSNYSTNGQKAINLGVYGADLSYANIFKQSQELMLYMNCAKKLADDLGITSAFDEATLSRIEENMNVRDSLMNIINDCYWVADAYLKENDQQNLSALIISGGWIEGLYLGSKTINRENPDQKLLKRIADQKHSLANLTGLLDTYTGDNRIDGIKEKLAGVQSLFDKIDEDNSGATVSVEEGDVPTIGGGNTLQFDAAIIFEIADEIEKIRNEIIQ